MTDIANTGVDRRAMVRGLAAVLGGGSLPVLACPAIAQPTPIKIGVMMPFTGTYAQISKFAEDGFRLFVEQQGGMLGGRPVSYTRLDDEAKPEAAADNMNRLVSRDKVDAVLGTVHSGVQLAMVKVARDTNSLLVIPVSGANEATGPFCAPSIFRTAFTNWQPSFPMGRMMVERGLKNIVTITWRYTAGDQAIGGFREGLSRTGGKIVEEMTLPFPEVEFQTLLTRIASLKPDAVFAFFAGGGAVKFVKDYAAAGLKDKIPLYGTFITDGTLSAIGAAAEGVRTTLHYADDLDFPASRAFSAAYRQRFGVEPDIYSVQGWDAAALLHSGLSAVKGDLSARRDLVAAMEATKLDSPRGPVSFSKAHNPIQNVYLREVRNGRNAFMSIAHPSLEDPGRGCRMA
jgi:branched-chain amino acid transport system substrate-binding protein